MSGQTWALDTGDHLDSTVETFLGCGMSWNDSTNQGGNFGAGATLSIYPSSP